MRIVGVQDGYDSARKGHKLQAGLTGIIGEAFREAVAEKTYSALESRALRGAPTGGRAYGYREGEADTVRRIFGMYADGLSAKRIAETLNREGVASPGSSWNRTTRRRAGGHLRRSAATPRAASASSTMNSTSGATSGTAASGRKIPTQGCGAAFSGLAAVDRARGAGAAVDRGCAVAASEGSPSSSAAGSWRCRPARTEAR